MDLANLITIVIAAKNESPTIENVVRECRLHSKRVIVVDGESHDGTLEIAARCGAEVLRDDGRGKGSAMRAAIPMIDTQITVFIDADGSHVPADIERLVQPIVDHQADHVSASRLLGGSSELHGGFDECFRLMGSSFITACINWRYHVRLSESQNGFRAIRTDVLRELKLEENSTTIEQEMIMKTLRKGYRIAEVPSHEHRRAFGVSRIRLWAAAPRYVFTLAKYLFL